MEHNHYTCVHELRHCPICDIVYCTKCGKEWHTYTITYGVQYPATISYYGTGENQSLQEVCKHN